MKKCSRILVLGLVLALSVTACKPETAKPQGTATAIPQVNKTAQAQITPTATKMPEINTDPKGLGGVKITYLHPWSDETGRVMDSLVDEFNQSNEWGIKVQVLEPGSTGLAIQALRDSDSGAVNVAVVPNYEYLYQDQSHSNVVDLNPFAASDKVGFSKEERADFQPVFWNGNVADGKLFGIPAQQSAAVLFYNTTWAKELGFSSTPQTDEAFKLQACAANATFRKDEFRSNDSLGGWIISTDPDTMISWMSALGSLELSAPLEKFNNAKAKSGFDFLFNLQKNSCAWPSRIPEPYDYFATRQTLVYSGTTQDIMAQSAAFARNEAQDEWQVIAYPGGENSELITSGLSYGVLKSDDQKELASWLFIRWLSQPANQARLLQSSGSLPLGTKVLEEMTSFEETYPQWKEALALLPQAKMMPVQANEGIIRMVLGDAGTFLFKPELKAEEISGLLYQLDSTIKELSNRKP